jgi:hypothetical protein
MPIADSKLGGSYVWVRASSEIKPGSAAPAATEAEAGQPQHAAAAVNPTPRTHCRVCDPPMAAAAMQPTPTPQTHCFICPPHTQAVHCWTAPVVCDTKQIPTPATLCTQFGCHPNAMPPTLWCTWVGCAPHGPVGGGAPAGGGGAPQVAAGLLPQTHFLCTQGFPTFCGCTPGIDCNAPGNVQTQAPICTQGFPTFCGCTPGIDCGGLAARAPQQANTGVTVCVTDCQPPMVKAAVGVNPMDPTPATRCFFCDPPNMLAAMQPTPTAQTHFFICPPHTPGTLRTSWFECHTNMAGCTVHICAQAAQPAQQTLATVCTQIGCPTHQIHCYTQPVVCNLQPTQPVVCGVLPPSFGCTQHGCAPGAAPQAQAGAFEGATVICSQPARCTQACMPQAQHGGGVTAATVCTMPPGCPPHTVHNCPPNTVNTPCATFVCPTLGVCPTVAACTPNGVFTPFGR